MLYDAMTLFSLPCEEEFQRLTTTLGGKIHITSAWIVRKNRLPFMLKQQTLILDSPIR